MRLIEWNDMRLLIRAERIEEIARKKIRERNAPIDELGVRFHDSLLEITGRLKKVIEVPFRIEIRRIDVEGTDLVMRIESITAAGVPVPTFLGKLFEKQVAGGGVVIEGDGPAIRIRLGHFLPERVDVTMKEVRIRADGIVAELGRGGVDPPEGAT